MHAGIKPVCCRYCDARFRCNIILSHEIALNCSLLRYQNKSNCVAHEKKVHRDVYQKRGKDSE